jgi:hypothetical protein
MATAVKDPYAAQLRSFTSNTANARRGLIDLYKLRRKNISKEWASTSKLYSGAFKGSAAQYKADQAALNSWDTQGMGFVDQSGYDTDDPATRAAVQGILREGTSPFRSFFKSEGQAMGNWYKGYKTGELTEAKTLQTGLKREQPAALSELEQGIIDVSSNLMGQSNQFQAQQQQLAQQQAYMQQMLQYQGQMATAQQQGLSSGFGGGQGGGGLSSAEQWIIGKESSNNVYADNPTSTAFGLGQLLLGNRQTYGRRLGYNPNTTNYSEQLAMMRAYISDRYGTAEAAMRFWQQHGWY